MHTQLSLIVKEIVKYGAIHLSLHIRINGINDKKYTTKYIYINNTIIHRTLSGFAIIDSSLMMVVNRIKNSEINKAESENAAKSISNNARNIKIN